MSTDRAPYIPSTEATVQPYRPYDIDVTPNQAPQLWKFGPPRLVEEEAYVENDPVVWVPDAYGQMVPMRRSAAPVMQPTPPRDLAPRPVLDPRAQCIAASGVLAAGTGWGVGQVVSAFAGLGAGALVWLAIGIVAWKIAPAAMSRTTVENRTYVTNRVTNNNRGFGRSNTTFNR
ncbi:hypothetical protein [Streptomyces sp. NPDC001948]